MRGFPVALFNIDGTYHAISNLCPHAHGPLAEGDLFGAVVRCPWHQWAFDVRTGDCPERAGLCVPRFLVRREGDDLLVSVQPAPREA